MTSMRRTGLLFLLVVTVAALMTACAGNKDAFNPGTPLGAFHVHGTLTTNSCGDQSGATATWDFDIHLSRDHDTLYWDQGGPPVEGQLDQHQHTTMTSSDTRTIQDADPRHGVPYCGLTRDDRLDLTLANDLASFTASLSYTFTPTDGSDCSSQLTLSGGIFATLPCTTSYALTASKAQP